MGSVLHSSFSFLPAGGPFFAYPWKPLWNRLEGSTYDIAYMHFRRDHVCMLCMYYVRVCIYPSQVKKKSV